MLSDQIWDRPRHGREFFEEVIRENIDLGRPETVRLIFARKMRKSTVADGRCRTQSESNPQNWRTKGGTFLGVAKKAELQGRNGLR